VDNSEIGKQAMAEGKPPKCIHIYNKKGIGTIGTYLKIICEILFSISHYKQS
jgi:large subunit ribosomal protein L14